MKNYIISLGLIFLISGCIIESNFTEYLDNIPPLPPEDIYTITGDNWVELHWIHNLENDLQGYNIYRAYSYYGRYEFLGFTERNYFIDFSAQNGMTYYYAITAIDYSGNESDLSKEVIYDTPRPEGYNQTIFDFRRFPERAGYDFSTYSIVPYDDDFCDMFFDYDNGKHYMVVYDDTDIQDMGPTNDIYDISEAPLTGWSPTKDVRLYVGHTYVVWTWNNHFAKFRVKYLSAEKVVFDWAYQLQEGNRELKSNVNHKGHRYMNKDSILRKINKRYELN